MEKYSTKQSVLTCNVNEALIMDARFGCPGLLSVDISEEQGLCKQTETLEQLKKDILV